MRVLGIETSCDETGIAIYDSEQGLLAHAIYSQIELHAQYGGVVPELASRDHVRKTIPLVQQVLNEAKTTPKQLSGIAYTAGPGLVGALLTGASIAKSLAYGWQVPAIAVHHMEGHLLAPMLEDDIPEFPFIALLVSGGHTMLVNVKALGDYELLGESVDDAAGEAFDKTAKLLGLPYPGGPHLAKLAELGDASQYDFPRPMVNRPGCDFSFSGLKTFVLNTWHKSDKTEQTKANIAAAFQEAVVETLSIKCKRALEQTNLNRLVIAGGVGANKLLREQLEKLMLRLDGQVYYPKPELCTDNGAMIAYAGYRRLLAGDVDGDWAIKVKPRWPLTFNTR